MFLEHLKNDFLPAMEHLNPLNDFIYVQDSASLHRSNIVQHHLKDTLRKRYVKNTEWPPNSPACNPLDVPPTHDVPYEGRLGQPFATFDDMKARIEEV